MNRISIYPTSERKLNVSQMCLIILYKPHLSCSIWIIFLKTLSQKNESTHLVLFLTCTIFTILNSKQHPCSPPCLTVIDCKTNIVDRQDVGNCCNPFHIMPHSLSMLALTSWPSAASCKFQFQSKSEFETDHFLTFPLWHQFSVIRKKSAKQCNLQ